jgi:hypothetical protein
MIHITYCLTMQLRAVYTLESSAILLYALRSPSGIYKNPWMLLLAVFIIPADFTSVHLNRTQLHPVF